MSEKRKTSERKRGRPDKPDALTPQQRKQRLRESKPGYEARQKEKERQRERILRFHIARNHLYGYGIPEAIDQGSDAFTRVRSKYLEECAEPVQVEIS